METTRIAAGTYQIIAGNATFTIMNTEAGWELSSEGFDIGGIYTEKTLKEAKRMVQITIIENGLA